MSGRGVRYDLVVSLAGTVGVSDRRTNNSSIPSAATGSPCLSAQGSRSLTPGLPIPHLPYSPETLVSGQPCHQPQCDTLWDSTHWLVPVAHVRLSPWLLTEKGGELPLPRAMRSFQQKMIAHRLELSYLSCRALTILQLSGRGGRAQEHAMTW